MASKKKAVNDDANAFRQQVRMAAVQVAGLQPEELSAALAYEVEPFSGIPAAEAEVAFAPVVDPDPSVRVYDVVVRRRGKRGAGNGGERLLKPLMVLGVLALLLAAGDFTRIFLRTRTLECKVAEQARLQSSLDSLLEPAKRAREEARAIRERREAARKAQDDTARWRSAHANLLRAIAAACGDKAVLRSLEGGPANIRVVGVAVSSIAAADVLVALTASAAELGWRLAPGPISARAPGMTAEFTCELNHD